MKVKELIEELQRMPQDAEVYYRVESQFFRDDDRPITFVNTDEYGDIILD